MKKLYVAMCLGVAALFSISLWKNSKSYQWKSAQWRLGKSAVDTLVVVLSALFAPALLVSWTVMWLTRGIKRRGIQITLAVILGIVFGSISGVALEILCVFGIFGVDLLTGSQGLYGWWNGTIPESFLPRLKEIDHGRFQRDTIASV